MTMRRIIGTIGATVAVVATIATPAAAQDRGDRDNRGGRDTGRIFYTTSNQGLPLSFDERRPDRVVDAQPIVTLEPHDGNPRRSGPETLDGDGPVTGGGQDSSEMIARFSDDEGDDWFDELEEDEFDSAGIEWLEITSYEQMPAYPSGNDVYMTRAASAGGAPTTSGGAGIEAFRRQSALARRRHA
jgi:hypothetical protein